MKTIQNFLSKTLKSIIEAREQRAAAELARYLKIYNSDFRNVSEVDLAHAIKSKKSVNISELSF